MCDVCVHMCDWCVCICVTGVCICVAGVCAYVWLVCVHMCGWCVCICVTGVCAYVWLCICVACKAFFGTVQVVPVPEDQLPVSLPQGVKFTGRGPSPLLCADEWLKASCGK